MHMPYFWFTQEMMLKMKLNAESHTCAQSAVYPTYILYSLHSAQAIITKNKSKTQYLQTSHGILTMNPGKLYFSTLVVQTNKDILALIELQKKTLGKIYLSSDTYHYL